MQTVTDRDQERYIARFIDHIEKCGWGLIGGQPQPYAILFHELEVKVKDLIENDEGLGQFKEQAEKARLEAIKKLKEMQKGES